MQFETSDALCEYVKEQHGAKVLLSFSTGKDSIACWLQLRKHGIEVYPVYMYSIPDLEFVEQSLRYFERVFDSRILRLPHPSLYRQLNALVFQPPEHCAVIEQANLLEYDYADAFVAAKHVFGLPQQTLCAVGVRAVDSPQRWTAIKRHGPLNQGKRTFYPVFDWRKDQLISTIKASGVKLPIDYKWFGRTFDGLDYRFMAPLRENAPRDFERVKQWFPLVDLEMFKMECRRDYYA